MPGASALPTSFRSRLLLILALGLLVRLVYALALAPPVSVLDDDAFFHATARLIAGGDGFVRPPAMFFVDHSVPTAEHPPLYPMLLAVLPALGIDSVDADRMVGVPAGTATVLVVALIARRVAGDTAGLIAAALAAAYPSFVAADGAIMSETLFGLLVALAVLVALRLADQPRAVSALALGALIGLATLTRSEGLLLLPLLGVPILLTSRRRVLVGSLACLATLVVLAPWLARNWHHFDRPLLSNNAGTTLAGANCDKTYYGSDIAWFDVSCIGRHATGRTANEAKNSARLARRGLDYASDHAARATLVAGVRVARVWGVYQPGRQVIATGRRAWAQRLGVIVYYPVLLLAALGAWSLRRRRVALAILLAPVAVVCLVAAGSWGSVRFRHEAEVVLIALAGVASADLWRARRRDGRRQANGY